MPSITDRIEQAPTCEVINLTDAEREIYTGAGWKIARFENGRLTGLFDLNTPQESAECAMNRALGWLSAIGNDEAWLVMCSCGQLCEPRRVTLTDASALARMTRVFAEQFTDQ